MIKLNIDINIPLYGVLEDCCTWEESAVVRSEMDERMSVFSKWEKNDFKGSWKNEIVVISQSYFSSSILGKSR